MPVYDFTFAPPQAVMPTSPQAVFTSHSPMISNRPAQLPDVGPKTPIVTGTQNIAPDEVISVVTNGFHLLDEGMKNWLSNIKIPTLDGYKSVAVHVAASDKSILSWAQEFFDGRVPLPVISVHRASWAFDQTRFSPPYSPIAKRFTDQSGRFMRNIFRPVPFKVEYAISIWAEFKKDVEHIEPTITRRCNPAATFNLDDDHVKQFVRILYNGTTNSSDIEIAAKVRPKVIYDLSMSAEYAIPIDEKIVPTVLGRVMVTREMDSHDILDVYKVDDLATLG